MNVGDFLQHWIPVKMERLFKILYLEYFNFSVCEKYRVMFQQVLDRNLKHDVRKKEAKWPQKRG